MSRLHLYYGGWLGLAASSLLAWGTTYYALVLTDYNAVRQTISELAAADTPMANRINYTLFLPVGLLQWTAVMLQRSAYPEHCKPERRAMLLFSWIGLGYALCAIFPCDPGSPLLGSWRQQVHNLSGAQEYVGGGVGLVWLTGSERFADHLSGTVMLVSGGLVLYCLAMITIPDLAFRGLIQRFADELLFGWLALASAMQLAKPEPILAKRKP